MSSSRRGQTTRVRLRPRLTAALLDAPVRHTASVVALALLDVVVAERGRLPDGSNALHNFRVALRRLRSWLRAFRPWLPDSGRRNTRHALAALADASNHARDFEVGLAWLEAQRDLPPLSRRELSRLVHRLRHELRGATRTFNEHLSLEFTAVVNDLEQELMARAGNSPRPGPGNPPTRTVHAALVRAHAADLGAALRRVRTVDDEAFAHRARIAGKRLRYLLEHVTGNPEARQAVRRLIRLQDALGEFHDACVLIERLHFVHPALVQRTNARMTRAFARVERGWLGATTKRLLAVLLGWGEGARKKGAVRSASVLAAPPRVVAPETRSRERHAGDTVPRASHTLRQ